MVASLTVLTTSLTVAHSRVEALTVGFVALTAQVASAPGVQQLSTGTGVEERTATAIETVSTISTFVEVADFLLFIILFFLLHHFLVTLLEAILFLGDLKLFIILLIFLQIHHFMFRLGWGSAVSRPKTS